MNKKDLPVIPSDRSDDLHNLEIADSSDLVLFMAGNQFMAMGEKSSLPFKKNTLISKKSSMRPFLRVLNLSRFYPAVPSLVIKYWTFIRMFTLQ